MIKVLIERHIAEDLSQLYDQLSRETLQQAMQSHGFISGEVLHDIEDTNHRLVVATYRTTADWYRWHGSPERREMMDQLAPLLDAEEKITIYEH